MSPATGKTTWNRAVPPRPAGSRGSKAVAPTSTTSPHPPKDSRPQRRAARHGTRAHAAAPGRDKRATDRAAASDPPPCIGHTLVKRILLVGSPRLGYVVDALRTLRELHDTSDDAVLVVRNARAGIEHSAAALWKRRGGRVEHVTDVLAEVKRADAIVVASGDGDELALAVLEQAIGIPIKLHWVGAYPFPAGEESAEAQRSWAAWSRAGERVRAERAKRGAPWLRSCEFREVQHDPPSDPIADEGACSRGPRPTRAVGLELLAGRQAAVMVIASCRC